jgi:hypothetical protein
MSKSFGPWSTAINTGAPQQLDTFWKRRLAMLPSLDQTKSGATRRTVLLVAALAVAALALPTMKRAIQAQSAGTAAAVADDTAQQNPLLRKVAVADRRDRPGTETKAPDASVEVEYLPRPTNFEEQVLAALEKPTDVEFSDLGLEGCLNFLSEAARIPFWMDKQTLTDEGVALDQPITLKLKGARLESVLNLLLNPIQLSYLPENDVLMITTSTKAGEKLITRTYPVRDLLGRVEVITTIVKGDEKLITRTYPARYPLGRVDVDAGGPLQKNDKTTPGDSAGSPAKSVEIAGGAANGAEGGGGTWDFTSLMNLISTTTEPDSWEDLSGPGSMMPYRTTLSLVVRQTSPVHRQILQLLRDLREAQHLQGLAPDGKDSTPAGHGKR